jgi:prevent-host-death family protein
MPCLGKAVPFNRDLIRLSRELIRPNWEHQGSDEAQSEGSAPSEAKNRLGQLLDLVERGEEIIITRHGKAVARLVPPKQAFTATKHGPPYGTSASARRS